MCLQTRSVNTVLASSGLLWGCFKFAGAVFLHRKLELPHNKKGGEGGGGGRGGSTEWLHPDNNLWLHQSEQHSLGEGRSEPDHTPPHCRAKQQAWLTHSLPKSTQHWWHVADEWKGSGWSGNRTAMTERGVRHTEKSSCGYNFNEQLHELLY